jgi:hypothetical protein
MRQPPTLTFEIPGASIFPELLSAPYSHKIDSTMHSIFVA